MTIEKNILKIKNILPTHITLVAVSKTKSTSDILEAYQAGQKDFGENKVQELVDKQEQLTKDIQWHMIGHLQSNKVKYIAPFIHLIHGVESLKLLQEIDKQALKNKRIINCLLQLYIAQEETKFGLSEPEFIELISSDEFKALKNIKIVGLMGMASFTDNKIQIEKEFTRLRTIFGAYKDKKTETFDLNILSMGMSNDYEIAIACGSTMVRIGSSIFVC